jgi:cobalt/nickel transport system ATP-binding protein
MYAVEVQQIDYVYPNGAQALSNLSLTVPIGSRLVILGRSKSGKTTLLNHLAGLLLPQKGRIMLKGVEICRKNKEVIQRQIGLVEQEFRHSLFVRTVWEYVTAGLLKRSLPKGEMIRAAELALGLVGLLPMKYASLTLLSPGEKRKVALAAVLAKNPDIILLDQPLNGLDPQEVSEFSALLQSLHLMGKTILLATHDVDFSASWADHIVLLSEGRVLAQGSAELTARQELMKQAGLRLPLVSMPFAFLPGWKGKIPVTLEQAVRELQLYIHKHEER